jgi:hypothetical protein
MLIVDPEEYLGILWRSRSVVHLLTRAVFRQPRGLFRRVFKFEIFSWSSLIKVLVKRVDRTGQIMAARFR